MVWEAKLIESAVGASNDRVPRINIRHLIDSTLPTSQLQIL